METVEIVKVYENKVWVESDLFGGKHVMVQSASPRAEPLCYCSFHYGYGYTDNASIHNAATRMAISLGATEPVEFRTRPFELPNAKVSGPEAALSPEGRARLPGCAPAHNGE